MSQEFDAQAVVEQLVNLLGFEAKVDVDEQNHTIDIDCDQHALLIGKKGETLRSLQHLINAMIRRHNPELEFYSIDVGGYKKARIEKLQHIATEAATEVVSSGREKRLPSMNAFERRQVHMVLAENPDITTASEGEEPHRAIVIYKR